MKIPNLPKSIDANKTIGTTQLRSMRKPNKRFPIRAPPLPNVNDNAAAITLKMHIHVIRFLFDKLAKKITLNV